MKKAVAALFVLLSMCGVLLFVYHPVAPDTAYETAALLLESPSEEIYVAGREGADQDEVFRALESVIPAPFLLRYVGYEQLPVPVMRYTLERRGKAAQAQAELLATGLAREATAGLTDPMDKLRALHDFVVMHCVYDAATAESLDELDGFSTPFTAYGVLAEGKAVCAGYARAYMLLCQTIGLEVIYVTSEEMNHGWNAVRVGGETLFVDCTFDDPIPDMGQYALHDYCLVTADELRKTHTWDEAFYEGLLDQMENN